MKPNLFPHFQSLSSRKKVQGFTLLELLITALISGAIISSSLGLINAQRNTFLGDRDRANINDNLKTAMNIIGADAKLVGERLEIPANLAIPPILPVVSVIDGTPSGKSDTLILQRKLMTESLTICQPVVAGQIGGTIDVDASISSCGSTTSRAIYTPTAPYTQVPNVNRWRERRCAQDGDIKPGSNNQDELGCVPRNVNDVKCAQLNGSDRECLWGFIINRNNPSQNEFFLIADESEETCAADTTRKCWRFHRAGNTPWQFSYANDGSTDLYILEEREYRLSPDTTTDRKDDHILELTLNRQTPQRITNLLDKMEISAIGGTTPNSFNPNRLYQENWQTVKGIEVSLKGLNQSDQRKLKDGKLTLKSTFYPRNAASVAPPTSP
jgi:prepilin-type N-terminal cleavage/methylation domain-containing protein